jgi:hypothetical protein
MLFQVHQRKTLVENYKDTYALCREETTTRINIGAKLLLNQ